MITSNLERCVDIWYTSFYCGCGVKGVKVVKIKHEEARGGLSQTDPWRNLCTMSTLRCDAAVQCRGAVDRGTHTLWHCHTDRVQLVPTFVIDTTGIEH